MAWELGFDVAKAIYKQGGGGSSSGGGGGGSSGSSSGGGGKSFDYFMQRWEARKHELSRRQFVQRFNSYYGTSFTLANLREGIISERRESRRQARDDPANKDAFSRLKDTLSTFGLASLAPKLWEQIKKGEPESAIYLWIREQPEYKQRFPGMFERERRGLSAISEAEYIQYEREARAMMRMANLPKGFYDEPSDFAKWIGQDVSLRELDARVTEGFLAASQAPREVRDELERLYGVSEGELAAFFLSPGRALPIIQERFRVSQLGAASIRVGMGELARSHLRRLESLGVTPEEAAAGFGQLVSLRELFTSLPGERARNIGIGQQLAAAFEGDAEAQEAIERRGRSRAAVFEGGRGEALTDIERGVAGLGTAQE